MADVITLSSSDSDEEKGPPKKKIKLITVTSPDERQFRKEQNLDEILITDSDDDSQEIRIVDMPEKVKSAVIEQALEERSKVNLLTELSVSEVAVPVDEITIKELLKKEDKLNGNGENEISNVSVKNAEVRLIEDSSDNDETVTKNNEEGTNSGTISNEEISIIEDSTDSDTEKPVASSTKSNIDSESSVLKIRKIKYKKLTQVVPSTSKEPLEYVDHLELSNFLKTCAKRVKNSSFENPLINKFPDMISLFKKLSEKDLKSETFRRSVDKYTREAEVSPAKSVLAFKDLYMHIKAVISSEFIELPPSRQVFARKLEKTIKKLIRKIKSLEEAEVDFDEDSDSAYVQQDRYMDRLIKTHKMYCELLKTNPYAGRLTHEKLSFVSSEYNEINRALSKKYKNNSKFPSYSEFNNYVRKVVKENNLKISEIELKKEINKCFEKLGNLLQTRRKKELYESHCNFILQQDDPAISDPQLETQLKKHAKIRQDKIDEICREYVLKQEAGQETIVEEESESDKSSYIDSDENEEQKQKVEETKETEAIVLSN